MPKYTANAYLSHKGKIIQVDELVELTEEQAERLGDKVTHIEGENDDNGSPETYYTEASLKKLSADEQKSIVTEFGGDLDELTNEEKRITFILEKQ